MYSIYQRHFLLTAGMILLSFLLLGSAFMGLTYRYTVSENQMSIDQRAEHIASVMELYSEKGIELTKEELMEVAVTPNADVMLCDLDGTILFSYNGDNSDGQVESGIVDEGVLQEAMKQTDYHAMSDLGIYQHKKFVSGVPIVVKGERKGFVFLASSTENLTAMWREFALLFLICAVVVLVIAFLSSFFTTRQQAQPLREVIDVVRRFGMGEYDLRVQRYNRTDEIGQLAMAVNTMADSIASAEERRQEFVANISHELKTPMTTIAGFSDGILDGTIPPEKQRECLQVISDETRRLSRLVRRMLDMSQLSTKDQTVLTQTQFNIVENFAQVLISLERKINDRHLDVDAQFPDNDVMVWGEPDDITQVCYNLMDNAIKFAKEGTAIGVSIVPQGNKAYISVRNVGETIPPDELNLVFDRFHKSDRSRSLDKDGVGLGLYIVKTILNRHKETITVTSQNGLTEFQFTLTLAE
jgi:signal transduction histidine kinase